MAGVDLVDIALSLHRQEGKYREYGLELFEDLIKYGAYGAKDALDELDGNITQQQLSQLSNRRK